MGVTSPAKRSSWRAGASSSLQEILSSGALSVQDRLESARRLYSVRADQRRRGAISEEDFTAALERAARFLKATKPPTRAERGAIGSIKTPHCQRPHLPLGDDLAPRISDYADVVAQAQSRSPCV